MGQVSIVASNNDFSRLTFKPALLILARVLPKLGIIAKKIMKRAFKKNLRCVFLLLASINLVATLPPAGMVSKNLSDKSGDRVSNIAVTTIGNADICTAANFIIPKAGHDLTLSDAKRLSENANFSLRHMLVMAEIKLSVELNNYFFRNDLHFNTPRIAFRQPRSEHTSEG